MQPLFGVGNNVANAIAYQGFRATRENGRDCVAGGVRLCFFLCIAGSLVVQTKATCDAHSRCVFGNCAHRDAVFVKLHNSASIVCSHPWVILVGTHDVVAKADLETRLLVAKVRDACPTLKPEPAYCTRSVVKTKEDTFLISTTTAILILRYFQLAEGLAVS